ncbi:DUF3566 domain-containing protein [Mycobacterium sp. NPDC003323]
MTSPNEPGNPTPGPKGASQPDGGTPARRAQGAENSEVPPWQRGPAARAANPQRPTEPVRSGEPSRPPARSPGTAAQVGQFLSGTAVTPTRETREPARETRDTEVVQARTPDRPEGQRPENYASELPDLSAPASRPGRPPAPAEGRPPAPAGRVQVGKKHHGPVRASMQIRRIDPWSTLKVSLVLSGVMFFVWMIAVAFLYLVLGGMGVWTKLNSNVGDLLTSDTGAGGELISSGTIFGGATLIGLVNIVLLTAMATAGAFIYNLITDLVGGVEVTLADRD